jgi:hypothetical protein
MADGGFLKRPAGRDKAVRSPKNQPLMKANPDGILPNHIPTWRSCLAWRFNFLPPMRRGDLHPDLVWRGAASGGFLPVQT